MFIRGLRLGQIVSVSGEINKVDYCYFVTTGQILFPKTNHHWRRIVDLITDGIYSGSSGPDRRVQITAPKDRYLWSTLEVSDKTLWRHVSKTPIEARRAMIP
jgi:hypothetical protein